MKLIACKFCKDLTPNTICDYCSADAEKGVIMFNTREYQAKFDMHNLAVVAGMLFLVLISL